MDIFWASLAQTFFTMLEECCPARTIVNLQLDPLKTSPSLSAIHYNIRSFSPNTLCQRRRLNLNLGPSP